jgi:hypothetical protein
MSNLVRKAFATTLRRFKPGDQVADGEDLSPHTIDSLKAAGLVGEPPAAKPAPQATSSTDSAKA